MTPASWAPVVDETRSRQSWVALVDLTFTDAALPAGTVLRALHEDELSAMDRSELRRRRRRATREDDVGDDMYAVLGVDRGVSDADLKAAYRALAKIHHPDVNPGDEEAEERFKEINTAFMVLSDVAKRRHRPNPASEVIVLFERRPRFLVIGQHVKLQNGQTGAVSRLPPRRRAALPGTTGPG